MLLNAAGCCPLILHVMVSWMHSNLTLLKYYDENIFFGKIRVEDSYFNYHLNIFNILCVKFR